MKFSNPFRKVRSQPKGSTNKRSWYTFFIGRKKSAQRAFFQNYFYGFTGVMIPVAVYLANDGIMLFALFCFYSSLSIIVNRDKYTTNLGKFFYFPFPAAMGGFSAYKIGIFIRALIDGTMTLNLGELF